MTAVQPTLVRPQHIRWLFTASVFLSAFLLFSIQPMFARMVLPVFGGAPAVWAISVCLFQVMLLGGYLYAHLLGRLSWRRPATPLLAHLAIMAAAITVLPLSLPDWLLKPTTGSAYSLLLEAFGAVAALPFFALSANAPLLQSWFGRLGDKDSGDPYFLYAASNAGSLLALLSYPLAVEPLLPLRMQAQIWSLGFIILVGLISLCGWLNFKVGPSRKLPGQRESQRKDAVALPAASKLRWAVLAFIPSGLLVALTTFVTTDLASAPLLWVIPLSVYLVTFIIAFSGKQLPGRALFRYLIPAAAAGVLWASQSSANYAWLAGSLLGLLAFFLIALECHLRLYEERPASEMLTAFYLWLSFGGALGGLFSSLAAPQLFTTVAEFPLFLGLGMAAALLPKRLRWPDFGRPFAFAAIAAACALLTGLIALSLGWVEWDSDVRLWTVGIMAVLLLASLWLRPLALAFSAALVAVVLLLPTGDHILFAARTFFGTHRVLQPAGERFHYLLHGVTLHGLQYFRSGASRPVPLLYYHKRTPLALGLRLARNAKGAAGAPLRIGIVGLGSGAMACHAVEGDRWRFFEIDETVVRIAKDPDLFSYLSECAPEADIKLGDARLTLSGEQPGSFDFLMIDAFSSDAIPVHLLTVEALKLYLSLLSPEGVLALHLTNQNLDLAPVVESNVKQLPSARSLYLQGQAEGGAAASEAILIAKDAAVLAPALSSPMIRATSATAEPWTDDFSNIAGAFWRRYASRLSAAGP